MLQRGVLKLLKLAFSPLLKPHQNNRAGDSGKTSDEECETIKIFERKNALNFNLTQSRKVLAKAQEKVDEVSQSTSAITLSCVLLCFFM